MSFAESHGFYVKGQMSKEFCRAVFERIIFPFNSINDTVLLSRVKAIFLISRPFYQIDFDIC